MGAVGVGPGVEWLVAGVEQVNDESSLDFFRVLNVLIEYYYNLEVEV